MFTRCPKCKEVHPLTAEVLSRSTGLVQCGKCDRIFNALSFLSDDWHASQTFKPSEDSNSELPVLGGRWRARSRHAAAKTATDLQSETTDSKGSRHYSGNLSRTQTGDNSQAGSDTITNAAPEEPDTVQPRRWLWGLAATALILLTLMNAAWTFRDHLLQLPTIHQWALDYGWITPEKPQGMYRNPADIQLVSRDMHTHPTRTGILVLSITFVNLAQQTQAFPVLRITLLDAGNQPIAQRRLQPAEYLRAGANISAGLATDVFLPILLELADPGERAVGFEIEFL